ncbi:MAG: TetR/AcrR family transcriptional regulator [Mesorhizobium sp.]|nr:TetR/AcrR family transcriptional regulator [Mesorhizobium sp.]MCO5162443.1 TetR/AcrR family transcriptional regulator [Mesorhizobium sp.]
MILAEVGIVEPVTEGARIEILDAAAACFMERGYAATSIDDVARRLRATKGRIYHHFSSKADLFAQIFRHGMDMNFAAIEPCRTIEGPAVEKWIAMARVHATQMIVTQAYQRTVWEGVEMHLRGATTPEQRSQLNELVEYRTKYGNIFRELIARAKAEGDMDFENISIANQLMFMTLNSPIFWYSQRPGERDRNIKDIVDQVVAFALRGLGGRTRH